MTIRKWGPERLANATTANGQGLPIATTLTNGSFLIAWSDTSANPAGDARARLFDAAGKPLAVSAGDFVVNTTTNNQQSPHGTAALGGGRFVVTFSDNQSPDNDIRARLFEADGTPVAVGGSTNDFTVNTTTAGLQYESDIAPLAGGGFVVSFTQGDAEIFARMFDANGVALSVNGTTSQFMLNSTTVNGQSKSALAALPTGGFVVVFEDKSSNDSNIRARLFDATGNAIAVNGSTNDFLVNVITNDDQVFADVATLSDGGFVVVWTDFSSGNGNANIRMRMFNADGTNRLIATIFVTFSGDYLVNEHTANIQTDASVTALRNGGFLVTWADHDPYGADPSSSSIRGQLFDAKGLVVGANFLVNTTTTNSQDYPATAELADGRILIAWQDSSQTGGDTSSTANRFQILDPREGVVEGTGNADTLYGNDVFSDQITGYAGSDILFGLNGDDVLYGAEGIDTLNGGNGDDVLFGGQDADTLNGGAGNDSLTGDDGTDALNGDDGDDILDGGAGMDFMSGGIGNDQYFTDTELDSITEDSGQGFDRVFAYSNYALPVNVEIEVFSTVDHFGTAPISLSGNFRAESIIGNDGANVINGGGGADTLWGRAGNDQYIVNDGAAIVQEQSGAGIDRVFAGVSYTLGDSAEVEIFTTTDHAGTAAINLTGNFRADYILGNAGANIINGRSGSDTLGGFGGADKFLFNTTLGAGNVDVIEDFVPADDTFWLDNAVFSGLPDGVLAAGAFRIGTAALDADDRIIYNNMTGAVFFDPDGVNGASQTQFVSVTAGTTLVFNSFSVI